jgi:hypothetical protein
MKRSKGFLMLAVCVLVFGFVSCDSSSEPDTWSDVTSAAQLLGTWNGKGINDFDGTEPPPLA